MMRLFVLLMLALAQSAAKRNSEQSEAPAVPLNVLEAHMKLWTEERAGH